MQVSALQQAFLGSSALHLMLLLGWPAPAPDASDPRASQVPPLAVKVALTPPPARAREPGAEPVFPLSPVIPLPRPEAAHPARLRTPDFLTLAAAVSPPPGPTPAPRAQSPRTQGEADAAEAEKARAAAIEALFEATREAVEQAEREAALISYRFRVRERVRLICEAHHPGARLAAGTAAATLLLRFEVHEQGEITGHDLIPAPGEGPPPAGLEVALGSLGPLPPPPPGAPLPLPFEFEIYFQ